LNRTSVEGPNELSEARRALTVLHCTQPSRRSSFGIFRRGFPDVVPGAKQRAALERELENVLRVAKADAYEEESHSFSNDAKEKKNKTPKRLFADVRGSVAARRALFVALWLTVLGQLSAGPVIQYFPKHIFELAGHVAGDADAGVSASSLTVWTSFFKVVATGVVATFVDTFGRRFFFAFGITAQLAACVVLALAFGNHGWDEDARGVRPATLARRVGGRVGVSVSDRVPTRVRVFDVARHRRRLADARSNEHHGRRVVSELVAFGFAHVDVPESQR
jgi:hypothetical protein